MKKVVIIGAGPAGITAGYELLKASGDYEVTIFEETSELGGISRTVKHNGNRMDIGGHRFFSKDDAVTKWWLNLMPIQSKQSVDDIQSERVQTLPVEGPNPDVEDNVMLLRNRVSRIYYRDNFFDYPISLKPQTIKNLGVLQTIKAGVSYLKSRIFPLEESCLENFYINRFGQTLYTMFFEGYTEKLWGRHPRDISADWGAQRVKGLSVIAIIKNMTSKLMPWILKGKRTEETSLIEEFYYPKYGPGQLWEIAGNEFELMGGVIRKQSKVVRINTDSSKRIESVTVESNYGEEVMPADILISSMPIKDLITGMNDVPQDVSNIAMGLPYRDFITVGLLVSKLKLKNEKKCNTFSDLVPDCWIYVQDTEVKLGRIQIFNNWSPYMVADPRNTIWIGLEYFCNEGDDLWNMDRERFISFASEELIKIGVISNRNEVLDSHHEKVRKAYPAYFDTYKDIDRVKAYLNNFENLFCVGRNGQHRYNNMDHSMVTSFETIKNILNGDQGKCNIWEVNTEKSYHESRS